MPQADDPSKPNIKISRYLHHCTRQRVDPTSWRVAEMFAEIAPVLSLFEDLVGELVSGGKVTGTIVGADRAAKILVFKFKRKKQYKKTIGHRQSYTEVKIGDVVV